MRRAFLVVCAAAATAAAASPCGAQGAPATTSLTGDLGVVGESGNANFMTESVGDRLLHRNGRWTFSQTARYVHGTTNHATTASEMQLGLRADDAVSRRFGVFASIDDGRNTFAGYRARVNEAVGVDWRELETATDSVALDLGAEYTEEWDDNRTSTRYPAGRIEGRYTHAFSPSAYFLESADFEPDFRAQGGRRINSESALVAPLSRRLALKVDYQIRYESRPPTGYRSTDRVVTTGLQVTY
jgi:putative salt-induced outer membrane protein